MRPSGPGYCGDRGSGATSTALSPPSATPNTIVGITTPACFAGPTSSSNFKPDGPLRAHQPINTSVTLGATVHVAVPADVCTIFADSPPEPTVRINQNPRAD